MPPLQTLEEREAVLAQAEQTTRQEAEQLEDRRRQTQELVAQVQLQEAQQVGWYVRAGLLVLPAWPGARCLPAPPPDGQNAPCLHSQDAPVEERSDVDTDDDKDEVAEYEAWRERELQRIARDRCAGVPPRVLHVCISRLAFQPH